MGLKGAKDLDGRGLAVLRELHLAREALAVKLDRPPFMILGNESLIALAALKPRDGEAILTVRGCTANVVRRAGEAILAAVERGLTVPESELPVRKNRPRPSISGAVQRRREVVRLWRVDASKQVGLDPGVIFPQRLIDRLSADPPKDVEALARVEGVGRWRAELFGADLLRRLS
jgi:ribonuclease D